jgi:hypothetical protein
MLGLCKCFCVVVARARISWGERKYTYAVVFYHGIVFVTHKEYVKNILWP